MSKQNFKFAENSYVSQCLSEFLNKIAGMDIAKSKVKKIEKELLKLLANVKESVFRKVEQDYHREDLMNKIKEYYGVKGLMLAKCLPDYIINGLIEDWQDDLGNADTYWEITWEVLENRLAGEVWLSGLRKFKPKEITLYKCYLTDWFKNHREGSPVCIREFFDCEMKNDETRGYYLSLASKRRRKANG